MLGKRIINTGGGEAACTTDTTQILNAGSTQSTALYRFEDNVNDTSNSTGKFSKGAVFNGSSSVIQTSGLNQFFNNWNNTSWSAWINTTDTSAQYIACESTDSQNYKLIGSISSNKFQIVVRRSSTVYSGTSTTTMNDGNWHHIVATYESSTGTVKGYIDGSEEISFSTGGASSATFSVHDFCIGANKQGSNVYNPLDGKIDQFRLFNKVISASEVTTLYNETTSTVNTLQVLGDYSCIAAYTFEGNANDLSTNYNGTASNIIYDYNGTASNITYATGKFGKAAVFNGSNSSIILPQNTDFDLNGAGSFSIWINRNTTSQKWIFEKANGGSGTYGWQLYFNSGQYIFQMHNTSNGVATVYSGTSVSINTWEHIVVTHDGSNVFKMYLNGVLKDTSTLSGTVSVNTNGARFGEYSLSSGLNFDGEIDQTRFFTKELNSGEINSLYNETATSAASATIDNPSTVAYYKMASASDETGSYNGTASNVDFNVQGKYGFAGKFNGSSSYITTPSVIPTNNFSFSFWINMNSFPGSSTNQQIFTQNENNNRWYIAVYESGKIQAWNGSGTFTTSSSVINLNQWHNVVYTASNSAGKKIYVDGTEVLSNADTNDNTGTASGNLFIGFGKWYANSLYLDGKLDQVRIFNKTISAAEVTKLYNEVQCAATITTPEDYFNTKLYTGNGGTQALTGVGFAPGMTWIKARSIGYTHSLQDTLRGPGTATSIYPDANADEGTYGMYGQISAFGTDGFTVASGGHSTYGTAQVNQNGVTYASWNWKTADSTTTNNDGATQSTVRASQESGFSVVKYTGTGSATTVGHGLNKKPNLIIFKNLGSSGTSDMWPVYASPITADFTLYLSENYAAINDAANYNDTEPTSSVFTVGTWNGINKSSVDYVAYCISNIDGYQHVGSYTGNGSANGPFVYTGFEPAWIMIKRTDSARNWRIIDNKRSTTNPRDKEIYPNLPNADGTYNSLNFHTNGFQVINTDISYNASGGSYLFYAIAANPDTTAPTKANSFKSTIWSGTGSARSITGLGFKPDLIWWKARNASNYNWKAVDSINGPTKNLYQNLTNTLATDVATTSFDNDGFTFGSGGNGNVSGLNYASYAWKGLDHDRNLSTINNDGSILSMVSANPEAGFSVVKWTGTGVDGKTIGHGLGAAPEFIITKGLSNATSWVVGIGGVSGMNVNDYLTITEYDKSTLSNFYQAYSTNTFQVGVSAANEMNKSSSNQYISYCFRSISGISKIGTYTGNGSTTGPITTTGFEPQFLLVKRLDANARWVVWDNKRDTSNTRTTGLNLEGSYAEITGYDVDFLSNGFQLKDAESTLNANGGTYLYMTFK